MDDPPNFSRNPSYSALVSAPGETLGSAPWILYPFFSVVRCVGLHGGCRAGEPNSILPPWLPLLFQTQVDLIQQITILHPVATCVDSSFKRQTKLGQFQNSHLSSLIRHLEPQRAILKLLNASRKEISSWRHPHPSRVAVSVI